MAKRRRKQLNGPPPVSECDAFEGTVGPPIYQSPMPPAKSRGRLIPLFQWAEEEPSLADAAYKLPQLLPTLEEVAKLPLAAREAFATRCAARVAPLREGATSPEAAAALILAAATVATPIRKQLLCIRRDFDRLTHLAKKHNWTDDTPVPQEMLGPMWPENLTPEWAK